MAYIRDKYERRKYVARLDADAAGALLWRAVIEVRTPAPPRCSVGHGLTPALVHAPSLPFRSGGSTDMQGDIPGTQRALASGATLDARSSPLPQLHDLLREADVRADAGGSAGDAPIDEGSDTGISLLHVAVAAGALGLVEFLWQVRATVPHELMLGCTWLHEPLESSVFLPYSWPPAAV